MLKKVYQLLSSLNLGLWLMALVVVAFAAGSFSPGSAESAGLDAMPLFIWLKRAPLFFSWWLWLAVALMALLAVNTVVCTIEALRRNGRSIAPHLMHAGFLLIALAHLFSAQGSFKEPVQLYQGSSLSFPDGGTLRVETIVATTDPMGMPTSYGAVLRTPRGEVRSVSPNHPFFHGGYGIYLKEVAIEPTPVALFEVHKEPGALPALAGAVVFTIGNLMLLAARRGR